MKKNVVKMKSTKSNSFFREDVQAESALSFYVKKISNYPTLSAVEERAIAKLVREGDAEAKKKLVQANLKLVVTIARKAIHMSKIPFIDLIQEGNIGLMVAVDKFNWKLGYKFSTYAGWWIKQAMFKAISEQGYCMKVPVYVQETLSKFSKMKSDLEKRYNCQVKQEEVARRMQIAPEKIDVYLSAYSKAISIESGVEMSNGKELNVADILEDEKTNVFGQLEYENLQRDIEMVVSTLKDREQEVVRMRYGLGSFAKRTLEEIGDMYGVTKECIRQTELRALQRIRESVFGEELACYIAG